MSKKSIKELKSIIQADSGADAKTARAAYNEIEKRQGPLDFTVTMILGGRALENPKAPPKKPKAKIAKMKKKADMAYGGSVNGKKHMYSGGGSVTDNLPNKGLRKLAQTPKGRDAVQNMGFNA